MASPRLNKALFIGRVCREPELRHLSSGKMVANFAIAVSRGKEGVDFINLAAWEKTADICTRFLKKGSMIYVECFVSIGKGKDGKAYPNFNVETVQFLSSTAKPDHDTSPDPEDVQDLTDNSEAGDDEVPF